MLHTVEGGAPVVWSWVKRHCGLCLSLRRAPPPSGRPFTQPHCPKWDSVWLQLDSWQNTLSGHDSLVRPAARAQVTAGWTKTGVLKYPLGYGIPFPQKQIRKRTEGGLLYRVHSTTYPAWMQDFRRKELKGRTCISDRGQGFMLGTKLDLIQMLFSILTCFNQDNDRSDLL